MGEETARQAYRRIYGGYPAVDVELPELPPSCPDPLAEDDFLFREFLWGHIRFARSHGKHLPLKPRKRLPPAAEAKLRRDLEMIVYQASHALAYLEKRDDAEEAAESG